jgi:1-acyl-sn-glycerol-3-phosphate acyltransferase
VALALTITIGFLRLGLKRLREPLTLEQRAQWMHENCRLAMKALGIRCRIEGQPPEHGLLVSNHLSYLDIVLFGAALPCFFVSKAEVGRWPFFGAMGRAGGTLFLNRSSRASAEKVSSKIAARLSLPVPILFFPEGTSTDGTVLLHFHTRLFEPAIVAGAPVTAASVRYVLEDGIEERELCWFGDAPFLPHLWKALGATGFCAEVRFGEPHIYPHRRTAAVSTRAEIASLRGKRAYVPQE